DIVDIKDVKTFFEPGGDAVYFFLRFHGGPAWPNNAAHDTKDGVEYPYSRGYYHILMDTDNDPMTGWGVAWYEAHYTPVGYLQSQNVAGAEPIGAEIMLEWGARYYSEVNGGGLRSLDYWAADYSEYDGQQDTGSDYEIYNYSVVDADSGLAMMHDGLLLNNSSDDPATIDGVADWMAHSWGNDFLEVGMANRTLRDYFLNKDGSQILKAGDVIGICGMTETPIDDWGVDMTSRFEVTISSGTAVDENPLSIVETYELSNNYPNPFNPETTIDYTIAKTGQTQIVIYNVLGQKVHTLVDGLVQAGTHSIKWNGKNAFGVTVPSGVYYYTLKSNSFKQTKKMLLLK
ncbi:T9SS type A sorting domain-containing protein, partial [candidate division KSB1 bacterium]|nr:T9SS type A sorting domain-containing protein [candidate division KSB1 bacterium]